MCETCMPAVMCVSLCNIILQCESIASRVNEHDKFPGSRAEEAVGGAVGGGAGDDIGVCFLVANFR